MEPSNSATDPSGVDSEQDLLAANAEVIEEMRAKHDDIVILEPPKGFPGIIILAAPANPKTYQNFINQVSTGKADVAVETANFALSCVVHPDRATMKAIFAKRPGTPFKIAERAQKLCGAELKELGKD